MLGEVKVQARGRSNLFLNTPFVVNNRCERTCVNGLCTSACDYEQPIVGEFTLYEVMNSAGKREYIDMWYDGAPAPAQYQGLLYGTGQTLSSGMFEDGHIYEVEAVVTEPDLDYKYLSGQIERSLSLSSNTIGGINTSGTIGEIPTFTAIPGTGTVGNIPVISGLNFENSELTGYERALATWQAKFKNDFWPPVFSQICDENNNCKDSGEAKVALTARFSYEKGESRTPTITQLGGTRKSNFMSSLKWSGDQIPYVNCDYSNSDTSSTDSSDDWGDIN